MNAEYLQYFQRRQENAETPNPAGPARPEPIRLGGGMAPMDPVPALLAVQTCCEG